jgi:hypothetical protein
MREIRSYGSVRGVVGNRYPYRDSQAKRWPRLTGLASSENVEEGAGANARQSSSKSWT